jgi:TnsA endonuclease N terminal
MKTYKGKFTPRNPSKYIGDPNNIVYRSSWECRFMDKFDRESWVVKWSSEEIIVPYLSPVDGKWHRYFPDFVIQVKDDKGNLSTWMIEVKPKSQTKPPVQPSRKTKKFITEVMTWGVNQAKWKAAEEYCADRKWKFQIFTEDQLPKA